MGAHYPTNSFESNMALYFPNTSICLICGRTLLKGEEYVGFSAFLPKGHRLHYFSDGLFHKSCFETWSEKEEYLHLYRRFKEIWATRPKDLETPEEIDAWGKEAFKNYPPTDENQE